MLIWFKITEKIRLDRLIKNENRYVRFSSLFDIYLICEILLGPCGTVSLKREYNMIGRIQT